MSNKTKFRVIIDKYLNEDKRYRFSYTIEGPDDVYERDAEFTTEEACIEAARSRFTWIAVQKTATEGYPKNLEIEV
jgi:hypothetical protein